MTAHIVLPRPMDLATARADAVRHVAPRQAMAMLAERMDARVHAPDGTDDAQLLDRIRSIVAPAEAAWVMARRVAFEAGRGDVVFCASEAGGLQVAALCGQRFDRPRICMFVHNVDRPRARLALKWWRLADRVDTFLACSPNQVDFLRRFLGLGADRVRHVWDHTDTRFFTPGPASANKTRPRVVSVGLEQRDYKTLAAATHDLDVDVLISGFSKDAAAMARTFPSTLPANMSRRFYAWPDLVQLYRDADVVVVSCHENKYAAGVQSLMEASSCGRPVVVTATEGLRAYLDDSVVAVRPSDPAAMRASVHQALSDAAGSRARANRSHALALRRYDLDRYVGEVMAATRGDG